MKRKTKSYTPIAPPIPRAAAPLKRAKRARASKAGDDFSEVDVGAGYTAELTYTPDGEDGDT